MTIHISLPNRARNAVARRLDEVPTPIWFLSIGIVLLGAAITGGLVLAILLSP